MNRLRAHMTYANIVATLALFVALGGSSYAAVTISGKDVRNGSLTGKDIKRNSIGGKAVKESALRTVPNASRLGGRSGRRFLVGCPGKTFPAGGTCIEPKPRPPAFYDSAVLACADTDADRGVGRRLPTYGELFAAFTKTAPAPGGELTSDNYPSSSGDLNVVFIANSAGSVGFVPNNSAYPKAFRCAVDPIN